MTTKEKLNEKREKSKTSERVIIDNSSVTQPGNGQGKSFKGNADIPKTNGEFKDINGTFCLETPKKMSVAWKLQIAQKK